MKKINFTKMVASGNDFAVIDSYRATGLPGYRVLARRVCDRKFGIGADGLLLLGKSRKADVKMRIFNADGSEAEMCGNGARCTGLYVNKKKVLLETRAGMITAELSGNSVKIKLTNPWDIKLDLPVIINNRKMRVNFINTGVPHAVIFAAGLNRMHILEIARAIRYHQRFAPRGTNVNFVEMLNKHSLRIRTYERGVEDETLACGTGSVAAALIFALKGASGRRINLLTQGGETLKVYFRKQGNSFGDVWLEGRARIVYKGEYYV